jgi:HEAT repeat protein
LSRRLIASVSASLILLGLLGGVGWWVQARERDRREAIIVATAKTVAAVRADLRSADYQKRHSAAIKILELGPLAKGAVPDLSAALKAEAKRLPAEYKRSENMLGTEVAPFARALWSIGEPAEACLLDLLNEREIGPRLATVWALSDSYWTAQTGPSKYPVAVRILRKGLRDPDARVRFCACNALGSLWPTAAAKDALPDLFDWRATDPDQEVRAIAGITAGQISSER